MVYAHSWGKGSRTFLEISFVVVFWFVVPSRSVSETPTTRRHESFWRSVNKSALFKLSMQSRLRSKNTIVSRFRSECLAVCLSSHCWCWLTDSLLHSFVSYVCSACLGSIVLEGTGPIKCFMNSSCTSSSTEPIGTGGILISVSNHGCHSCRLPPCVVDAECYCGQCSIYVFLYTLQFHPSLGYEMNSQYGQ